MSASQFVNTLPLVIAHLQRGVAKEPKNATSREVADALSIAWAAAERWRIEASGMTDEWTDDDEIVFE